MIGGQDRETRSVEPRSDQNIRTRADNAQRLGAGRVRLRASDWYSTLATDERFELIVSNPPYIPAQDTHLQQGDLRFEPAGALTDFADGLSDIRRIIAGSRRHLVAQGWLLFEHGYDQAPACRALLLQAGFEHIASVADLAGIERVTLGQWPACEIASQPNQP